MADSVAGSMAGQGTEPVTVAVRLFAGARAATGRDEVSVTVPAGSRVADALESVVRRHPGLALVLPACSLLLDGVSAGEDQVVAGPVAELDVLPPFSGG